MNKFLTFGLLFVTLSAAVADEDRDHENFYYYFIENHEKELVENNEEGVVISGSLIRILQYCDHKLPIIGTAGLIDTTCFRNSKPFKPTKDIKNLRLEERDDENNYYFFSGDSFKKMKNNTKPGDVIFSVPENILHYCDLNLPVIGDSLFVACIRNDKPFKPTVEIKKKVKHKVKLR